MNVRCACNVRVSTDDQRDNVYSIDAQLRMIHTVKGYVKYEIEKNKKDEKDKKDKKNKKK